MFPDGVHEFHLQWDDRHGGECFGEKFQGSVDDGVFENNGINFGFLVIDARGFSRKDGKHRGGQLIGLCSGHFVALGYDFCGLCLFHAEFGGESRQEFFFLGRGDTIGFTNFDCHFVGKMLPIRVDDFFGFRSCGSFFQEHFLIHSCGVEFKGKEGFSDFLQLGAFRIGFSTVCKCGEEADGVDGFFLLVSSDIFWHTRKILRMTSCARGR